MIDPTPAPARYQWGARRYRPLKRVDDVIADQPEIYFEAGDHEKLIRMNREDFRTLMDPAGHARFAAPI